MIRVSIVATILLLALNGCGTATVSESIAGVGDESATGSVTISFNSGNDDSGGDAPGRDISAFEISQYTVEDVASETTVETIMRRLADESEVQIELSGRGLTAFVVAIENLSTTDGKGWIFTVDGAPSPTGIGTTTVDPPAKIDWHQRITK